MYLTCTLMYSSQKFMYMRYFIYHNVLNMYLKHVMYHNVLKSVEREGKQQKLSVLRLLIPHLL